MTNMPPGTKDAAPAQSGLVDIETRFPALHLTRSSRFARRLGRLLLTLMFLSLLAAVFVPWQQSIRGEGAVVARDPFERTQVVQAQVKGLVKERGEGVTEAAYIEKGQMLFRVVDQNPQLRQQLAEQIANTKAEIRVAEAELEQNGEVVKANERVVAAKEEEIELLNVARDEVLQAYSLFVDQAKNKYDAEVNKLRANQAKLKLAEADYQRKQNLANEGLESQLKLQEAEQKFRDAEAYVDVAQDDILNAENGVKGKQRELESYRQEWEAKITKVRSELAKALSDVSKAQSVGSKIRGTINAKSNKLLEIEGKSLAQALQEVPAPQSGYIMDLAVVEGMSVKPGDTLCRIVPKTDDLAVQVWVKGNDAPLIHSGDHVRLQFEGWPAVQFSGWPSVAVGTFGGTVSFVDPTDDGKGKFRIVITPDEVDQEWPEHPYLRPGVRANSWVLLDQVPLGYEVWRRMNGFPPALESVGSELGKQSKPPKIKL